MVERLGIHILIPTYNEASNIISLFRKIDSALSEMDRYDFTIVVIDDNSPDGTKDLVKSYTNSADSINIHLITNPKKSGLGNAYIKGMKYAIENGAYAVITMDADHSHNPKYLPSMIDALEENDIVVCTRYVRDGGSKNWKLTRRLLSRLGNLYTGLILGRQISDYTGGFNGYNIRLLKEINLDSIRSKGYSFQIELKYRLSRLTKKIVHIPIIFGERMFGVSKIDKKIVIEGLIMPLMLRMRNSKSKF